MDVDPNNGIHNNVDQKDESPNGIHDDQVEEEDKYTKDEHDVDQSEKNIPSHDGIHNGQVKEKEKNDTQDEMDDDKMGKKCDSLNRIHTAQQKENDIQDNVAEVDHNYIKTETKSDGIVNEVTIMNSVQGEMTVMNSEVKPDGVGHKSIVTNSEIDGKDTPHLDIHYKIDAEGRSDFSGQ